MTLTPPLSLQHVHPAAAGSGSGNCSASKLPADVAGGSADPAGQRLQENHASSLDAGAKVSGAWWQFVSRVPDHTHYTLDAMQESVCKGLFPVAKCLLVYCRCR